MANSKAEMPALNDWQVDTLRLTCFPIDPGKKHDADRWWRDVTGEERQNADINPVGMVEHGRLGDAVLAMQCGPEVVNWIFQPYKDEEGDWNKILTLGALVPTLERFLPMMEKWLDLETVPIAKRLALGSVILLPVSNREDGYKLLQPLLSRSVRIDPVVSQNFLYQINRRRKSKVKEGLEINRLTKWFVWEWQPSKVQIHYDAKTGGGSKVELGDKLCACRMDLDINTVQEEKLGFDSTMQKHIIQELKELMIEIVREGDVP
jgi:hypothetical protein